MKLSATIANSLWIASSGPSWLSFRQALHDPCTAQTKWLSQHLGRNAETRFGRLHHLNSAASYAEFAARVPLMSYEQAEPFIERIKSGEPNVLTAGPVTHLIPTSGSSGSRKLIPFTRELQQDFDRAIAPWICDLARQQPGMIVGPAYWSISPPVSTEVENSQVPVGFADDAEYLGGMKSWLVNASLVGPERLAENESVTTYQFKTLRSLLRARDLRLISIWHPSFLLLLLDALPRHWDALLEDLPDATRLREIGPHHPRELWPQLRVISCWGDAHAELSLRELKSRFPEVLIQPKGLLATEAFVTIPFAHRHPLAVRSHFFEFLDETGRMRLVDELRESETYEVVVTTSGGLWRYRLGDLVLVTGWVGKTPSLRFLGRKEFVSDLCGEKLSEHFVADVIREVINGECPPPRFAMLAPADGPPTHYCLYWDGDLDQALPTRIDRLLRQNPQYDLCRRLGQLEQVQVCPIRNGYDSFVRHQMKNRSRLGEIKPCALSRERGWRSRFAIGAYGSKETETLVCRPS